MGSHKLPFMGCYGIRLKLQKKSCRSGLMIWNWIKIILCSYCNTSKTQIIFVWIFIVTSELMIWNWIKISSFHHIICSKINLESRVMEWSLQIIPESKSNFQLIIFLTSEEWAILDPKTCNNFIFAGTSKKGRGFSWGRFIRWSQQQIIRSGKVNLESVAVVSCSSLESVGVVRFQKYCFKIVFSRIQKGVFIHICLMCLPPNFTNNWAYCHINNIILNKTLGKILLYSNNWNQLNINSYLVQHAEIQECIRIIIYYLMYTCISKFSNWYINHCCRIPWEKTWTNTTICLSAADNPNNLLQKW